ncbi:MAG: carbohydrate-binding protein, partial [Actinobacteria bacterium]|nr:carbohydrate-binding protein [Actinomycetota bacterium]
MRGERPVLSGALRVRGWKLYDAKLGIWVARVPKGIRTRQLYVNGVRAVRARGPLYPTGFSRTPSGYQAADDAMSHWRKPRDLEAVTLTQWKMMRCPVGAITGREIVMQQPCWANVNVFPAIWAFQTITWWENAYELLDTPGEWYLDSAAGRLYSIPRLGQKLARDDVELPRLQRLVEVRGTAARPVERVSFQGLTFAYATWLNGANGYADDQSGFHLNGPNHSSNVVGHDPDVVPTPGNVRLAYARHVAFIHDDFRHLGGVGLELRTGSKRNAVIANRFDDISSAAVQLGGVAISDGHPASSAQVVADNIVTSNLVRRVSREYQDTA